MPELRGSGPSELGEFIFVHHMYSVKGCLFIVAITSSKGWTIYTPMVVKDWDDPSTGWSVPATFRAIEAEWEEELKMRA